MSLASSNVRHQVAQRSYILAFKIKKVSQKRIEDDFSPFYREYTCASVDTNYGLVTIFSRCNHETTRLYAFVCAGACAYACAHACASASGGVHVRVCVSVCMFVCAGACTCVCALGWACVYMHVRVHACVYACGCGLSYVRACVRVYVHVLGF